VQLGAFRLAAGGLAVAGLAVLGAAADGQGLVVDPPEQPRLFGGDDAALQGVQQGDDRAGAAPPRPGRLGGERPRAEGERPAGRAAGPGGGPIAEDGPVGDADDVGVAEGEGGGLGGLVEGEQDGDKGLRQLVLQEGSPERRASGVIRDTNCLLEKTFRHAMNKAVMLRARGDCPVPTPYGP
jgi:hypothetical protein